MNNNEIGLLTTLLLGIFILIGAGISLLINKKNKIIDFSIGLAFGVIVTLIVSDLLPEIFEVFGLKNIYLFIIFTILGFFILRVLDEYIPDHHEHKMNKKESNENLVHIGIMTTVALVLHNIIEGVAVYSTALADSSIALSLALGVGFHNIPLGIVIASSFYHSNKNTKRTVLSLLIVSLSTFCGGLLMYLFNLTEINEMVLGIFLSLTLGMLLFIIVDELIVRIKNTKEKKTAYLGIITGVLVLVIGSFIGE